MGVDQRFAGVAGFSYVELVRERRAAVYPAGDRPYYCLPSSASPVPACRRRSRELTVPGARPCASSPAARRHARLRRVHRDRRHLQPRPRDVRGDRAGLRRRRRARARSTRAATGATGWIVGLFDAEPILASAVARDRRRRQARARPRRRRPSTGSPPAPAPPPDAVGDHAQRVDRARRPASPRGDRMTRRMSVEADGRWTVSVAGAEPTGIGDPEVQATLVLVIWVIVGLLAFVLVQVLDPRPRPRAEDGRREDRPAPPPGAARRAHGPPEPRADHGPHRADAPARPPRTAPRCRRCSSTSTASRASTTPSAIRSATSCCASSPPGSRTSCATTDTIGRLGGDEFVVLVEGGAEQIAQADRRRAARAVRPRHRQPRHDHGQRRHRHRRPRGRQGPAARRRHRAVRGQGRRPQPLRRVPPRDAHRRARAARARVRPARRGSSATSCSSSTSRSSTFETGEMPPPRRCCAGSTRPAA